MAKFHGEIGFIGETVETSPGVWKEIMHSRKYYGDVVTNVRNTNPSNTINATVTVSNRISVVADAFAYDHVFAIRYVEWGATRWEVSSVEIERPRLVLTLGGVYNGETPATA